MTGLRETKPKVTCKTFRLWTLVRLSSHILDGGPSLLMERGNFNGGEGMPGHARRHSAVSCATKRSPCCPKKPPRDAWHLYRKLATISSGNASRSVQPFLHRSRQSVTILYNGMPLSPYKCSAEAEMDDRLVTIDMGRKLGAVPLLGGGAGSPCNTMRPGPNPTFVPSGI